MTQPYHRPFSYRFGFKEEITLLQFDSMNPELRNSLWNVLYEEFLSKYKKDKHFVGLYNKKSVTCFFNAFWKDYLKLPLEELAGGASYFQRIKTIDQFRTFYFKKFQWNEIYDFLEFSLIFFDCEILTQQINFILQRELSAWRFVGNCFTQITSEQEILMIEEALNDDQFQSVSSHLSQSLQLMSDKQKPDYRNSIKESISAVESLARIITDNPKATLGQALGKIEHSGKLHPTLKASFSSLYGYTSDEHGIRHSMLEEPNLTIDDAKFFLLSCTSFINYLKAKM